jgi:phosphatidylglycerophosphatase A
MQLDDEVDATIEPTLGSRAAIWIATGLGIGLVTPAPGTVAGLWGIPLAAAVASMSQFGAQLFTIAALALLAVPVCQSATAALGYNSDPGPVVLDEIVALPIVFVGVHGVTWPLLLVGYVLFRVCDIWKPGLAHSAEDLPGGWGIVADDCVAAVMACLLLHGAIWLDAQAGLNWLAVA